MNVFILNAGRTGSVTFIRACKHITNYTAGHETRWGRLGDDRLAYPEQHIEADNRLSWLLGRLDRAFGADAFYVHLNRDDAAAAKSLAARRELGIMRAYRRAIVRNLPKGTSDEAIALDYLDTIDSNIRQFLRDKPHQLEVRLEAVTDDFPAFWTAIGAEGDIDAAVAELGVVNNATDGRTFLRKVDREGRPRRMRRYRRWLRRLLPR